MSLWMIGAAICYGFAAVIAFAFSIIYLTRSEFMPYHREAIQQDWGDLSPEHQVLLLALMRAAAGGWLAVGISTTFLLVFPFRSGEVWARIAIPIIGLAVSLSALYATLLVKRKTTASPPVGLVGAAILLLVLGFILSVI